MADNAAGQRDLSSVSIITDLLDTEYIIVIDGQDVKRIAKKDLIKALGTADKVTVESITGLTATNVQAALAELLDNDDKLYTVNIKTTDVVANTNTWNTGSHAGWYPYCYTGTKGKNAAGTEVDMGVTAKDELCIQGVTETDTQALLDCENNGSYSTYDGSYKIYFRSVPTAAINLYISVKKKVTV